MRRLLFTLAITALAAVQSRAQVTLSPLFSDNMVMQRLSDNAPIWGQSKAGKTVKITTSWDGQTYLAKADGSGRWKTSVKTPDAGGPYTITLSDGSRKKTVLENVMIGEVWLCSGQSNMQMPVEGWGKVNDWAEEKADADNYGDIRLLTVARTIDTAPQSDFSAEGDGWLVSGAENVAEFSATAYFFGRELYKHLGVPIGLINASWGGTIIETWMSRDAFEGIPAQEHNLQAVESLPETKEGREQLYKAQYAEWLAATDKIIERDDVNISSYSSSDYDDTAWNDYYMPFVGSAEGTVNCVWWARKTVDIPQEWAGKELILNLGKIDDNDVTYFDGTSVGNTIGSIVPRNYVVPAELVRSGKTTIAIRVQDTGGLSGIDCAEEDFNVQLAGTDERIPLTGEWKYKTSINSSSLPPLPVNSADDPNLHTLLYNTMINPLVPYAVKGAVWYQGENNVSQAYQYRELMPMLIRDWRTKWGQDFPFIMVQLANYMHRVDHPQESAWAELREAQMMTRCNMAGVGMATTIDIGDADDIHPKNKQEVGRRLALIARNIAYGEDIACEGPLYTGYRMEGGKIRVLFTCSADEGLSSSDGKALRGFEIAGADRVWHRANAETDGTDILVSASDVKFPVAVRYAWADNPDCNLTDSTGLPASPFRTDDFEGVSYGNYR
ncbi:MAG: 9-O-acetylesterase [Prevotella sp.]|nr:9-O-acetylesterase [Prevotella sp.]